jgi:hypothetical protein
MSSGIDAPIRSEVAFVGWLVEAGPSTTAKRGASMRMAATGQRAIFIPLASGHSMRICIPSMAHAKRVSKRLQKAFKGMNLPLSQYQFAVARSLGYRDWHELDAVTASGRALSVPDHQLRASVEEERLAYQAERIAEALGIPLDQVHTVRAVLAAVRPSDFDRAAPGAVSED